MSAKEYQEGRKRELAKIHIAKKQLGLDEDTYRMMLQELGGASSAAKLSAAGRKKVIAHLISCGFQPTRGRTPHPGTPRNIRGTSRSRQLSRVEALLSELQKPWSYADAIAKRMHGTERVGWCSSRQLTPLIAALEKTNCSKGKSHEASLQI